MASASRPWVSPQLGLVLPPPPLRWFTAPLGTPMKKGIPRRHGSRLQTMPSASSSRSVNGGRAATAGAKLPIRWQRLFPGALVAKRPYPPVGDAGRLTMQINPSRHFQNMDWLGVPALDVGGSYAQLLAEEQQSLTDLMASLDFPIWRGQYRHNTQILGNGPPKGGFQKFSSYRGCSFLSGLREMQRCAGAGCRAAWEAPALQTALAVWQAFPSKNIRGTAATAPTTPGRAMAFTTPGWKSAVTTRQGGPVWKGVGFGSFPGLAGATPVEPKLWLLLLLPFKLTEVLA